MLRRLMLIGLLALDALPLVAVMFITILWGLGHWLLFGMNDDAEKRIFLNPVLAFLADWPFKATGIGVPFS